MHYRIHPLPFGICTGISLALYECIANTSDYRVAIFITANFTVFWLANRRAAS